MLTPRDLHDLTDALRDRSVLSVYLDAEPTHARMRRGVRGRLATAYRALSAASGTKRAGDAADLRAAFEREIACLELARQSSPASAASCAWVAFVSPERVHYVGSIPVNVPTRVLWHRGPVLAPYHRALKLQHPVLVAAVDARSARVYRHAWNALRVVTEVTIAEYERPLEGRGTLATRGRARPGARSAVSTEAAERKRAVAFRRMAAAVAERLVALSGDSGWIVIGGASAHARGVIEALPNTLADRVHVTTALDRDSAPADVARVARDAASTLRAARQRPLVDAALGAVTSFRHGARGSGATRRALGLRAVDTLLLTPRLLETAPLLAEHLTRRAIAQGASVEVLSGCEARRLDALATGVGARLRFALPWTARGAGRGCVAEARRERRLLRLARQRRQRTLRRVRCRA